MAIFEIEEAQEMLSELMDRVLTGEEILIRRNGISVAQLLPHKKTADTNRAGD